MYAKTSNKLTDRFPVNNGLRQECFICQVNCKLCLHSLLHFHILKLLKKEWIFQIARMYWQNIVLAVNQYSSALELINYSLTLFYFLHSNQWLNGESEWQNLFQSKSTLRLLGETLLSWLWFYKTIPLEIKLHTMERNKIGATKKSTALHY